jgi:hypothetical protein
MTKNLLSSSLAKAFKGGNWRTVKIDIAKLKQFEQMTETAKVEVGIIDDPRSAEIMVMHEFGTMSTPARPSVRDVLEEAKPELVKITARINKFESRKSVAKALAVMGESLVEDVKAKIDSNIAPKLSDHTVQKKIDSGALEPEIALKDTQQMYNAIKWKFVK